MCSVVQALRAVAAVTAVTAAATAVAVAIAAVSAVSAAVLFLDLQLLRSDGFYEGSELSNGEGLGQEVLHAGLVGQAPCLSISISTHANDDQLIGRGIGVVYAEVVCGFPRSHS